jgi:hypothetical protein
VSAGAAPVKPSISAVSGPYGVARVERRRRLREARRLAQAAQGLGARPAATRALRHSAMSCERIAAIGRRANGARSHPRILFRACLAPFVARVTSTRYRSSASPSVTRRPSADSDDGAGGDPALDLRRPALRLVAPG